MIFTVTVLQLVGVFLAGAACASLMWLGFGLCQTSAMGEEQDARIARAITQDYLDANRD